jgi:histidinol phosphatase-like enzyme
MEKIIFLDRDGVINVEPSNIGKEYNTKIKEFEFLPLVIPALKKLTEKNIVFT